jgi:ribonuclease BN (tRNA processing enzyme)
MKLTVAGCGDAFGSGGRLQSCYHVDLGRETFLIDCGATSLIGLDRAGISPDSVGTILISHLHGDHFSGLVWWYLHAVHVTKRRNPLEIVGPPGLQARFRAAIDALFPGALKSAPPFEMRFTEPQTGACHVFAGGAAEVTTFEVSHPSGAPSHALRIEAAGKVLAFSGDTEWTESLVPAAKGADLFLCECFAYDAPVRYHMNWQRLAQELPRIGARRVLLTHMSGPMLEHGASAIQGRPGVALAHDGMVIEV